MAGTATEVIATRDMIFYSAPYAAGNTTPADTIVWGTAWGAPYVDRGYTDGGLAVTLGAERSEVRVDQELDPILRIPTGRDLQLQTNLAQITPVGLQEAAGLGETTTVAPGGGLRGHVDLDVGSTIDIDYFTGGFDLRNPSDGEAFRVIGWRGIPVGNPTLRFVPTDKATFAYNLALTPDPANANRVLKIRDVVAAV